MAIKLVRKHIETENKPIKLRENLFVRVRDLSNETDMSIEELVNYFVEEAIKQVEFEDENESVSYSIEKETEVVTESTRKYLPVIPSEDDEPDVIMNEDTINSSMFYDDYLIDAINKAFGSSKINGVSIRNAIYQNIKKKLKVNSTNEIRSLYLTNPKLVQSTIDKAIEQRLKHINGINDTTYNGKAAQEFNIWLKGKLEENFEWKECANIRRRVMSSMKTGLDYNKVEELYKLYESKPDVVKRYAIHYIELAKNGNKAGGNVTSYGIQKFNTNSSVKKVMTPVPKENAKKEPEIIVLPNTDERTKMINRVKFEAKKLNPDFNYNNCLTKVYNKMKVVYGYNINEEKKRYYNIYSVHAKSSIEVVKSLDDLWNIFWNLYQNEANVNYKQLA